MVRIPANRARNMQRHLVKEAQHGRDLVAYEFRGMVMARIQQIIHTGCVAAYAV